VAGRRERRASGADEEREGGKGKKAMEVKGGRRGNVKSRDGVEFNSTRCQTPPAANVDTW